MKPVPATDMLGREIQVGDVIAYALTAGRSANLALYRVTGFFASEVWDGRRGGDITINKVQAQKLRQSYGGTQERPATLAMCDERALVVNDSVQKEKL